MLGYIQVISLREDCCQHTYIYKITGRIIVVYAGNSCCLSIIFEERTILKEQVLFSFYGGCVYMGLTQSKHSKSTQRWLKCAQILSTLTSLTFLYNWRWSIFLPGFSVSPNHKPSATPSLPHYTPAFFTWTSIHCMFCTVLWALSVIQASAFLLPRQTATTKSLQ